MTEPLNKPTDVTSAPIGIFDSGLGGLTVFKQVRNLLPHENLIYFGDTARVPYGTKGKATVQKFARQIANFLYSRGVKLIVVACNTASSLALEYLQSLFPLPIVGVVEPAARTALQASRNKRIGVIGTTATIASGKFEATLRNYDPALTVINQPCPLFVPLIEEGWLDSPVTEEVARIYLKPVLEHKIDTLILGCTHYPLIIPVIRKIVGEGIAIVDTAQETTYEVQQLLTSRGLLNRQTTPAQHQFVVTDFPQKFEEIALRFLGTPITNVTQIALDEFLD